MKKQKQSERFDFDQMPLIPSGKSAPVIKKPLRQRSAEWMHIQAEKLRREIDRRRRERERKRSTKPAAPSVGQLEKELARARRVRRRIGALRSALLVLTALALLVCAAAACFPAVKISGDSMLPALQSGDIVLAVRTQEVERGELVLFAGTHSQTWIKRVIALPGDEVNILDDGTVTVNGCALDEPYVSSLTRGDCDIEFPFTVPHGRIFVLGDHRALSVDSRHAIPGCIPQEQIIGRAAARIYPLDRLGKLGE